MLNLEIQDFDRFLIPKTWHCNPVNSVYFTMMSYDDLFTSSFVWTRCQQQHSVSLCYDFTFSRIKATIFPLDSRPVIRACCTKNTFPYSIHYTVPEWNRSSYPTIGLSAPKIKRRKLCVTASTCLPCRSPVVAWQKFSSFLSLIDFAALLTSWYERLSSGLCEFVIAFDWTSGRTERYQNAILITDFR